MAGLNQGVELGQIESLIERECRGGDAEVEFVELLSAVSVQTPQPVDERDLSKGARFLCEYIRLVPYMLKVAETAARNVGLQQEIENLGEAVLAYWNQEDDLIPDHMGAVGLLDDAYTSLSVLQQVSDQFRLLTGKHLFPEDLSEANGAVRQIIGEPYASELDQFVARSLRDADSINAIKRLASQAKRLDLDANSTIWGHGPAERLHSDALDRLGLTTDS